MGQFRFIADTKDLFPVCRALRDMAKLDEQSASILKLFEEGTGEREDMTDFAGCENILVVAMEITGGKNSFTLALAGMKDLPFGLHILTIYPDYGPGRNARFTWKHFDEDADD